MRIISLAPSNTEIVCELDASDKLVATTSLCDHEQALDKPSIGGWTKGIDFDKIENLEPDVILASDDLQDEAVKELNKRGIDTLQVKPHTVPEVYQSIEKIGKKVEQSEKAEEIVKSMKDRFSELELDGERIYCEEWSSPPMVSGNWIPGIVDRVGGRYFIEEGRRSQEFSLKELKEFNPEYIFLNICGAGENASREELLEREGWKDLRAVKNREVYVIDDSLLNRPSPSLVRGAERIVEKIRN